MTLKPHILKSWIKQDIATSGIKISDEALKHLSYLLGMWDCEVNMSIRFYVMGYAAGVQSQANE